MFNIVIVNSSYNQTRHQNSMKSCFPSTQTPLKTHSRYAQKNPKKPQQLGVIQYLITKLKQGSI